MPTRPWQILDQAEPQRDYLVQLSYLPLVRYRSLSRFWALAACHSETAFSNERRDRLFPAGAPFEARISDPFSLVGPFCPPRFCPCGRTCQGHECFTRAHGTDSVYWMGVGWHGFT